MKLIEAMAILLDALREEIAKTPDGEDFCVMSVMPGSDIPFDDDCDGSAWVRLVGVVPSTVFPNPANIPGNCASMLAYTIEVAAFRRAPGFEKFGNTVTMPTNEEHFEASALMYGDMEAMHKAIKSTYRLFPDTMLGSYVPQGPEGGVVGGIWTLTIGLE